MSQTKITIVGKLRFSEGEGLAYSLAVGKPPNQTTVWLEAGPENAHDWPGLGKYPEHPEEKPAPPWRNREAFQQWSAAKKTAEEDWKNAYKAYDQKRNADPAHRRAQFELMELQRREPQLLPEPFAVFSGHIQIWFYRDLVASRIRRTRSSPGKKRRGSNDKALRTSPAGAPKSRGA